MSTDKNVMPASSVKFFQAVYSSNLHAIRNVIKRDKVNPNVPDTRNSSHRTALLYACENQLIDLARFLLKAKPVGADVNKDDLQGRRPIWWAAQYGNAELAELLVKEFKCDVDCMDRLTGCTPLYRAIVSEAPEVCTILVHGGANVNLRRLGYGVGAESPLMKAVQMDNLAICQVLVNSLCDLDYRTEEGFTALHYAVAYRRYDIVEFLLENKINKHATSHSGITPLAIAIEHLNPAMVRTLIRYGYNMNKAYRWKETPLMQAISLHNEQCSMALVHWGCKLTPLKGKSSYFWLAASAGLTKLMKLLLYIKPTYINELWIQQQEWPIALQKKRSIQNWLLELSREPFTLKELSRSAIFRYIPYFPTRHTKLELPEVLLNYISYSDMVDERIYKLRPLREDCPGDCYFHHPSEQIQCADIEVSDLDAHTDYSSSDEEHSQAKVEESI